MEFDVRISANLKAVDEQDSLLSLIQSGDKDGYPTELNTLLSASDSELNAGDFSNLLATLPIRDISSNDTSKALKLEFLTGSSYDEVCQEFYCLLKLLGASHLRVSIHADGYHKVSDWKKPDLDQFISAAMDKRQEKLPLDVAKQFIRKYNKKLDKADGRYFVTLYWDIETRERIVHQFDVRIEKGRLHGEQKIMRKNSTYTLNMKRGLPHGVFRMDTGDVCNVLYEYADGVVVGDTLMRMDSGVEVTRSSFSKGLINGEAQVNNPQNGDLWLQGNYKLGMRHGDFVVVEIDGGERHELSFNNGRSNPELTDEQARLLRRHEGLLKRALDSNYVSPEYLYGELTDRHCTWEETE